MTFNPVATSDKDDLSVCSFKFSQMRRLFCRHTDRSQFVISHGIGLNPPPQHKRKRRWQSLSLRGLLLLVTVIAVWLAWIVPRSQQQKKIADWVHASGGRSFYSYQFDSVGMWKKNPSPPGPESSTPWLLNYVLVANQQYDEPKRRSLLTWAWSRLQFNQGLLLYIAPTFGE